MFWILLACRPDGVGDTAASTGPSLAEAIEVVPSDGLPDEVSPQTSNNNLDVVEHQGEIYLAFRTAPSHFASSETELHVVRSSDQLTWSHELSLTMGTDLREPRFLSQDGQLFLYYAVLGDDPLDFEPQGSMITVRDANGEWSEPDWLFTDGFIPWRVRVLDGQAHMTGYTGGEEVYDNTDGSDPAIEVKWLQSDDGWEWTPYAGEEGVVHVGGASEMDLAFASDGAVVAVLRNEAGEDGQFGSLICRGEATALGDWTCAHDPRKYDSPLVFAHNDRIWLIGRRHLDNDGAYDLGQEDVSQSEAFLSNQAAYWTSPKRCSLWEVDGLALTVEWVLDLPSAGDTCFASALSAGADSYMVYNYTSDPEQGDLTWLEGQMGPTSILRQLLTF